LNKNCNNDWKKIRTFVVKFYLSPKVVKILLGCFILESGVFGDLMVVHCRLFFMMYLKIFKIK